MRKDIVVSSDMGLRNSVVSLLVPPPVAKLNVAPTVQMDQKQCVFVPRVVVVPVGGTVEFLNSDRLLHNLHSAGGDNPTFNRTQPKGRTIPIVFRRPEIILRLASMDAGVGRSGRASFLCGDQPTGRVRFRKYSARHLPTTGLARESGRREEGRDRVGRRDRAHR